jgi:hypothetical protein
MKKLNFSSSGVVQATFAGAPAVPAPPPVPAELESPARPPAELPAVELPPVALPPVALPAVAGTPPLPVPPWVLLWPAVACVPALEGAPATALPPTPVPAVGLEPAVAAGEPALFMGPFGSPSDEQAVNQAKLKTHNDANESSSRPSNDIRFLFTTRHRNSKVTIRVCASTNS